MLNFKMLILSGKVIRTVPWKKPLRVGLYLKNKGEHDKFVAISGREKVGDLVPVY